MRIPIKKISVGIYGFVVLVFGLLSQIATAFTLPGDLSEIWKTYGMSNIGVSYWILFAMGAILTYYTFFKDGKASVSEGKASDTLAKVDKRKYGDLHQTVKDSPNSIVMQKVHQGDIIQEDKSVKRRLRDLFIQVDPNILSNIGSPIAVRMHKHQYSDLVKLIKEAGSNSPVELYGVENGPSFSVIMNGSLGITQTGRDPVIARIRIKVQL